MIRLPADLPSPYPLTRIELAVGMPLGYDEHLPVLTPDATRSPVEAFDDVVLRALQRPPCVVSFSGGRDSSTVLVAAAAVARREGLPLPVPVTLVVPDDPDSDEADWQAAVLDHVGISEREFVPVTGDRFDVVGPTAQSLLADIGVFWPFNLPFHDPIAALARGGSLLTGFGGDELAISTQSLWAERALAERRWRSARALTTGALLAMPRPVRLLRELSRRGGARRLARWLTARGQREAHLRLAQQAAAGGLGWSGALTGLLPRSRYVRATVAGTDAMAARHDVTAAHPFVDPGVLSALAARFPFAGAGWRTGLLRALGGERLPDAVLRRESKASFATATYTATSRTFAERWDGTGLDPQLVDAGAVREDWLAVDSWGFSASLMQQAWLSASVTS